VQGRGLRHLAQAGPQPGLVLRDRLQLPLLLAGLALRPGPLPAQLLGLPEALLDLVADHRALQEEADLLVGAVGQQRRRGEVALLGHGLLVGLAGGHLQPEAVGLAGRLGRLRGARQLERGADGVLDRHGPALWVAAPDRVGLRLAQFGGGVEHALDHLHLGQPAAVGGDLRLDLRAEVHGVGEQPLLVGLQVGDARVAGVAAALEDGDRPLH
jgi:hypothetical protein